MRAHAIVLQLRIRLALSACKDNVCQRQLWSVCSLRMQYFCGLTCQNANDDVLDEVLRAEGFKAPRLQRPLEQNLELQGVGGSPSGTPHSIL